MEQQNNTNNNNQEQQLQRQQDRQRRQEESRRRDEIRYADVREFLHALARLATCNVPTQQTQIAQEIETILTQFGVKYFGYEHGPTIQEQNAKQILEPHVPQLLAMLQDEQHLSEEIRGTVAIGVITVFSNRIGDFTLTIVQLALRILPTVTDAKLVERLSRILSYCSGIGNRPQERQFIIENGVIPMFVDHICRVMKDTPPNLKLFEQLLYMVGNIVNTNHRFDQPPLPAAPLDQLLPLIHILCLCVREMTSKSDSNDRIVRNCMMTISSLLEDHGNADICNAFIACDLCPRLVELLRGHKFNAEQIIIKLIRGVPEVASNFIEMSLLPLLITSRVNSNSSTNDSNTGDNDPYNYSEPVSRMVQVILYNCQTPAHVLAILDAKLLQFLMELPKEPRPRKEEETDRRYPRDNERERKRHISESCHSLAMAFHASVRFSTPYQKAELVRLGAMRIFLDAIRNATSEYNFLYPLGGIYRLLSEGARLGGAGNKNVHRHLLTDDDVQLLIKLRNDGPELRNWSNFPNAPSRADIMDKARQIVDQYLIEGAPNPPPTEPTVLVLNQLPPSLIVDGSLYQIKDADVVQEVGEVRNRLDELGLLNNVDNQCKVVRMV
jgi:hypothetical protein